ncbi:hypothetical protein OG689_19180 [Kitasatospora sp. NBC_00240]|uniref:hypothetical protein n=1 Tax=Kitasatospora sp. NBC_00240 TaxID=2903567 RepID=UPI0022510A0C|nr:hypothetical protein [Kitasatospora sp. NBC_00240]MCX5211390.1 hypothetical protein [Kitasatospora sp. NBC_00240]
MVSTSGGRDGGHDHTALDEIELAGELMIAATSSAGDRLPTERIDEVLLDRPDQPGAVPRPDARRPGAEQSGAQQLGAQQLSAEQPGAHLRGTPPVQAPGGANGAVPRPGGPAPEDV